MIGENIAIRLLCKIYKDGYYILWDEDEKLLFTDELRGDIAAEFVGDVVDELIERDFFDKMLYEKYGILTSRGIQKRYLEATKKRKNVFIIKEFLLINGDSDYIIPVNVNIISINGDINSINEVINSQSKVKESKVKESKVEYADNVLLKKAEFEKLVDKYGESQTKWMIDKLSLYKCSSGRKYQSDYKAILMWVVDSYQEHIQKTGGNTNKTFMPKQFIPPSQRKAENEKR
jgi:hypothetical protein